MRAVIGSNDFDARGASPPPVGGTWVESDALHGTLQRVRADVLLPELARREDGIRDALRGLAAERVLALQVSGVPLVLVDVMMGGRNSRRGARPTGLGTTR